MLIHSYIKKLLLASLVITGAAGFFVLGTSNSRAQDLNDYNQEDEDYYDPSDYQQWKDNFKETPVEEMAFRNNKKGCAQKMAFKTMLIKKYKSGDGVDDISDSPIVGPYMKEQYKQIQEKGVLQSQKDMMGDYQECIRSAEVEEDPGEEYDLNLRYGACDKLSRILLGTVEGIKNRKSMDSVIRKYANKFPDMSATAYKDIEDPTILIGMLYKKAKDTKWTSEKEKYESLYEQASQLVVGCAM